MPKMINKSVAVAATLVLALLATAPLYADAVIRHFALASSMPAADATVEEAHAIHLTFTQVPKEEGRLSGWPIPRGSRSSSAKSTWTARWSWRPTSSRKAWVTARTPSIGEARETTGTS